MLVQVFGLHTFSNIPNSHIPRKARNGFIQHINCNSCVHIDIVLIYTDSFIIYRYIIPIYSSY